MHWNCNSSYEDIAITEYLDALYGYAMVLTRNRSEAEDLVQETCVRAIRAMKYLRADSNVKSWMLTILRNIWLNQLRKQRTAPNLIEMDADEITANVVVEPSKGPHALYVSKLESEQVREAIRKLPVDFREVILLREYEELSYQEIAGVLNCPVGTVMSRLARARSKLRTLLTATLQIPNPRVMKTDRGTYLAAAALRC
ncbi:sigma-70 family RNA polymerase sigma factor [Granulicella sp. dw_53]|uniref:sigma-70 family RNA polymerase sigma factor n=1 Tax=Granulicella sp. dw_53 TaxID=2719792 RepID=UPI001BD2E269|nr:sigma-70 family RNA polymerase sigma factor [Granulicella sp. dw_53]